MSELNWTENTVACSISIHAWGNSKGVRASEVAQFSDTLAEKAGEKRISVSKRLLDCAEYKAIVSRDGFAGKWFQDHSVPSLFRRGVYSVATCFVQQWVDYVESYRTERNPLADTFAAVYEEAVERARRELGALYRAEDYPTADEVRSKFWVDVRYLELGVPGRLERISPEAFRQAQEELDRTVQQGKAQIEAILCQEATELVQGLRNALQGLDDGTLKRFHDNHIEKIINWSDLFLDIRNVTGFDELARIAESLGDLARGCEKDTLKSFALVRSDVKRSLDGALVELKGLMEARPVRQMSLD